MQAVALDRFIIAKASLWDLPAIRAQQTACFGADAYDVFTLLNLALTPGAVRLKAQTERALAGFVAAEYNRGMRCGWIVTVGVRPEYTSAGIGSSLILAAEHQLGASEMRLTVRRGNTRAIRLYEHLGYAWCGTQSRYYRDGEDGLVMVKRRGEREFQIANFKLQIADCSKRV
jgi:ribosomal protein S18 acetylase RimI-like enzyme